MVFTLLSFLLLLVLFGLSSIEMNFKTLLLTWGSGIILGYFIMLFMLIVILVSLKAL